MRIGKKRRVSGAYDSSSDAASAASTSPYQRRISTPQINLPLYGDPNQINPFAEMNQSYSTQTTMQIGIAQPNEPIGKFKLNRFSLSSAIRCRILRFQRMQP